MHNVKVLTYPDLTRQIRVYRHPIMTGAKELKDKVIIVPEIDPFRFEPVRRLEDVERSLDSSRKRTIDNIYMYSRSNVWDYFVTFTFSGGTVNRYDYEECSKKLSKWIKNMRLRYCPNMKYIVVPELHKDGAFHFHGLFSSVDGMDIRDSGKTTVIKYMKGTRKCFRRTHEVIYLFGRYKLGWMTATKIKSQEKVVRYITKYVTKDLVANSKGKRRYWISKNLDVPLEEVMLLDATDRFIFQTELSDTASYVKHVACQDFSQVVSVYEIDS